MAEMMILRDKPSIIPVILEWVLLFVLFVILLLVLLPFLGGTPILAYMYIGLIALLIIASTVRAVIGLVAREFQTLTLTEARLISERGIRRHNADTIPLDKVQTAHTQYGLFGRSLDYGNLVVSTAGSAFKIRNLPHPKQWEQEILERIGATRR